MQIAADESVQRDLMFIFDELSEFVVIFVSNLILSAVKMLLVSHKMNFCENEAE